MSGTNSGAAPLLPSEPSSDRICALGVRRAPLTPSCLDEIAQRFRARPIQQRVQAHIAARAIGEFLAIDLAQRVDAGITILGADFAVLIPGTAIKAGCSGLLAM